MKFDNYEIKKLFNFILKNKNIVLSEQGLFSSDILIQLRDIIDKKVPNDFELSIEQCQALINVFLKENLIIDEDTPSFISSDSDCINASIERDINSINYINAVDQKFWGNSNLSYAPSFKQKILNIVLKSQYILVKNSPLFLKKNYKVALNSIRKNSSSANYVDWYDLSEEDYNNLIAETIKTDYILSSNSCCALKKNLDIVLSSITKDINSVIYADDSVKYDPKILKYIIRNNYQLERSVLRRLPLSSFADKEIMKYALTRFDVLNKKDACFMSCFEKNDDIDKYIDRYSELFADAIKYVPTIKTFDEINQFSADNSWEIYRETNLDIYANIFGKICAELQSNNDYNSAISNLKFLNNMAEILGERYNLLVQAMEQYHSIIHNNSDLENVDLARDEIANLSALYVSMSKEQIKKEEMEGYKELLSIIFSPKKDHPLVKKKILNQIQKVAIKELYERNDMYICDFLKNIVKQYSNDVDEEVLQKMIDNFILKNNSKMDAFIKAPRGFNNYKRYEEARKLINRLNSKYIKYTDMEVVKYLDIIKYDINSGKYYYSGPTFEDENINRYNEYRKKQRIFEKIKQQIIFKAQTLEVDDNITVEELNQIRLELPFTDEFYEFHRFEYYDDFTFRTFMESCIADDYVIEPSSLLDDETYNVLRNFVINNGLIWVLLLQDVDCYDVIRAFDKEYLFVIIDCMKDIVRLSKKFNYDVSKLKNIFSLQELTQCTDDKTVAILGEEIIKSLCEERSFTEDDSEEILGIAKDLICEMVKRNKSAVPYIKGKTLNYKYSLYDSQDETLLLSGIKTDACFRVDGTDNDFLHYCALNKNGFVIKITDLQGDFVARASGFRNGNGVYINQLRTIYDDGGSGYHGSYKREKKEIIETFRKACNDIVETSQANNNEKDKIDFVFVTKSYAMSNELSNVNRDVEIEIGSRPMVNKSNDWKNFVINTKNLRNCSIEEGFTVDYGNYSLICMASSKKFKNIEKIKRRDIKQKDVKAVYTRERNKIIASNNPNVNILNKINRINGIYSELNNTEFELVEIPNNPLIFVGDNWYIVYSNGIISSSCVLDFDNKAKLEYEATVRALNKNKNKNNNVEQISIEELNQDNSNHRYKVLSLRQ